MVKSYCTQNCQNSMEFWPVKMKVQQILPLTLLHSERPKLYGVLVVLSVIRLRAIALRMAKTLKTLTFC